MSTTYGHIKDVHGNMMRIEAYGVAGTVKLELPGGAVVIAIDRIEEMDSLISALEIARDHVWPLRR